ncbi:3-deoxy-manno-octulosonate cytidylyltransferase [Sphingomonas sp. RS6]
MTMSSLPSFAIIIPARYASTRYPGKPLAMLTGASGQQKSLIQRSWECAMRVPGASGVWVATDDDRIADAVTAFGGEVIMTSPDCANGTERCADALRSVGDAVEVIVNLQGDAPLSPAALVPELVARLAADSGIAMATPAVRASDLMVEHLLSDADAGRVGGTTVTVNAAGDALYFSKRVLPYLPQGASGERPDVHVHLGVYAYRPEALRHYAALPASALELAEGLEQLRFLHMGLRVSVLTIDALAWNSIELNNRSDIPAIEREFVTLGID